MKLTELRHDYESTYLCTMEGLLSRRLLPFYRVFATYHVCGKAMLVSYVPKIGLKLFIQLAFIT